MTPGEAIERAFRGWEAGDVEAVAGLFAADGRYEDPLFPGPLIGVEAIREGLAPAMRDIIDCTITTRHVVERGEVGLVEARFESRLATGEGRLDFDFAMTVELHDDRVTRLTEYFDTRPL